ncbi:MAG: hypothetical protein DWQ19_09100 [Crenarchaeota archaeon]|nr:MAG: hypothetical protein DWQ19_09100 [Thermoproteota archaeon]
MPRYFAPITPEELREKFNKKYEDFHDFLYSDSKAVKDIQKIQFDYENWEEEEAFQDELKKLVGIHTLPNGMTFWGAQAGGDWEHPVFFILYWDGKEIRGYVPKEGNVYNLKEKSAFGNNEEADEAGNFDADKLIADVQKRILPKGMAKEKPESDSTTVLKKLSSNDLDVLIAETGNEPASNKSEKINQLSNLLTKLMLDSKTNWEYEADQLHGRVYLYKLQTEKDSVLIYSNIIASCPGGEGSLRSEGNHFDHGGTEFDTFAEIWDVGEISKIESLADVPYLWQNCYPFVDTSLDDYDLTPEQFCEMMDENHTIAWPPEGTPC